MKVEISEKELVRMIKKSVRRNAQKIQEQSRSDLSRKGSASATQPATGVSRPRTSVGSGPDKSSRISS